MKKNPREYTAIILAAGRGSRLGNLTDARPKCLVELDGISLLQRQVDALGKAGIRRIAAVTGYRSECIEDTGVRTIHNADWSSTNMVGTLMCALDRLDPPFVVSYSDIVYSGETVTALLAAEGDFIITYDTDWQRLWEARFEDPLQDAETFRITGHNRVIEIGGRPGRIEDIQGQFMGLLRIDSPAVAWIRQLLDGDPPLRQTLDSTGLLMRLIQQGHPVTGAAVSGGWCEIDDQKDLAVAEMLRAAGKLPL